MTFHDFRVKVAAKLRRILKEATLTDWIMAISTVCLLIVAVIAACISYFQWHEMHTGGVDTHELALAAKAQADATKAEADSMHDLASRALRQAEATDKLALQAEKSAAASVQSARDADVSARATKDMAAISAATLDNAKQNAQLDQRAWLSISTMRLTKFQADAKLETQLVFSNSGRSPALHVSVVGAVVVMDKAVDPNFLSVAPASDFTALRAMAPQVANTWTRESERPIGSEDKDRVEHGTSIIWAWGFIRYDDTFGVTHITQYCGYTRDRVGSAKIVEGMDFYLCPTNNGMN